MFDDSQIKIIYSSVLCRKATLEKRLEQFYGSSVDYSAATLNIETELTIKDQAAARPGNRKHVYG